MKCCERSVSASDGGRFSDCMLCSKPLVCSEEAIMRKCAVCGKEELSEVVCENGHYVCDDCHRAGADSFFVPFLLQSGERSPQALLEQVMHLPRVHMHGPEHHMIVPCVLLTAYRNCGGGNNLKKDLAAALKRAGKVPGGTCGYWGVCGAAAGAGIFMSVITGSTPLNKEAWPIAQRLTARCLNAIAEAGGPRCCKRTSRIA
ncbi:MAG: hypothetical protein J5827_04650, partial [Oscillospiraceae bacterium]|nr:hypothetical protein [Oscillospiraceae bacterium]